MRGQFFAPVRLWRNVRKKSPHTRHTLAFYTRNIQLNELSRPLNLVYAHLIAYLKRYGVRIFLSLTAQAVDAIKKRAHTALKYSD